MGKCCSKTHDPMDVVPRTSRISQVGDNVFSDIRVDSAVRYDEQIIEVLREEFKESPQIFLLNNLLMSIQFFENYRRDREVALLSQNKTEKGLNSTLLQDENMECIFPDVLFDIVNHNSRYRPLHGKKKHSSESLIPRRLFVVNNMIEVVSEIDNVQYTTIDKPACQVCLVESSRKGFVRLIQIDHTKVSKPYVFDPNQPSTSGLQIQRPDSDDEIYQYETISALQTPKLLEPSKEPGRRDTLPSTCFTSKKEKKSEFELREMQINQTPDSEYTEDDFFNNITYVDAKGFMNYFKNDLFPTSVGRSLGFTQDEIDLAKSIPGKIFCNLMDDDEHVIPCQVIPCVSIEWPVEQTFEFIKRENRPTIIDKNTGIRYKWPTDEMIKEMRTFKCVIIPKGYWMKKGGYSDATLEWEISFPKAERYLEARMSHAQMRCYLFLIVIHKVYIEPVTHQQGLLVEHIRCQMYWECEQNYKDWPEHRLGTKLIKIIENLSQRLSKSDLPDFFIKQKNHFRNIPKRYLQYAQKIFHDILQSPTVYFIRALRCVRYASGRFYSPFKFKEFYKMLTETQSYKLVNSQLMNLPPRQRKKQYNDPQLQWAHVKEQNRRMKILEQRKNQTEDEEEDFDKASVDSIDLEWIPEKSFELFKIKAILTEFIRTFIAIAKDVARFGGSENQTLLYLKQASYLNRIFESASTAFIEESQQFRLQISQEQEAVQRSMVMKPSDLPPATPVRNSVQFDFSIGQQLKNNLNLNNLHSSYNNVSKKVTHSPSVRIRSPVTKAKSDNPRKSLSIRPSVSFRKSVVFVEPVKHQ